MKFVSYNIQYSKGADGSYGLQDTVEAIRDADIIGLQEVAVNLPGVPDDNHPETIGELLPEYYSAFGAAIDVATKSGIAKGRAVSKRLQFGNMILSKWPILSTRHFTLPWAGIVGQFDMGNGVLEAVIDCPGGALRVYVTHLNFRRAVMRRQQLEWLVPKLFAIAREGTGVSGEEWMGIKIPPAPADFVVLGDFNLTPECAEYSTVVGESDFHFGRAIASDHWVDSWVVAGNDEKNSVTWFDVEKKSGLRLDYGFVSPGLAHQVKSARIDHDCRASDHQPYWFELAEKPLKS